MKTSYHIIAGTLWEVNQFDLDSKLWWLFSSHVHAEPYCGSDTDQQETEIGQCSEVAVGFIDTRKL